MESKKFFPMFKRCDKSPVIVFGGGNIALRRVLSLLHFDVKIKIISPEFCEGFNNLRNYDNIEFISDIFDKKHLQPALFVLSCTDDNDINKHITCLCKERGIDVNSASNKEDCTFYFPYLIHEDDITIGLTGCGSDHKKTKKFGDGLKDFLEKGRD